MLVAHSPGEANPQRWHELITHLRAVAELASDFAQPLGLQAEATWLGWWHDAGKAHHTWQRYLLDKANHVQPPPKSLDHSSVGMLCLTQLPLALSIAGHHGGLSSIHELKSRRQVKSKDSRIKDAVTCAQSLLTPHCDPSRYQPSALWRTIPQHACALTIRMMHSCLIDADCLDTERHFQPGLAMERGVSSSCDELWACLSQKQEELRLSASGSSLNTRRMQMYDDAVQGASRPPGFFSLRMPTGAGKTRTAMAFALRHATLHQKRRVIVAIPYTSIIEQNARVYRELLGDEAVLEHHASLEVPWKVSDESDQERWQRLSSQNWDSPVIITTNVQLFESLFASKNGRLRKLHRVAGSVIILDEVQTLPPEFLALTLQGLRVLVEHFGCTVVFSTATLPALSKAILGQAHSLYEYALEQIVELVQEPQQHFEALRRVEYHRVSEPVSWTTLAHKLIEPTASPQALLILNTVRDTLSLLKELKTQGCEHLLYLSTRLCAAHRREVLDEVRRRLNHGEPCLLISTQVVEAGVDLDFPVVWRALGPLDAIVQAAGRCNREGLLDKGDVYIFEPEDGHIPPGVYTAGREIAKNLLSQELSTLHTPQIHQQYFRLLYGNTMGDEHNLIKEEAALDFPAVAQGYKLIDDDTVSVLVRRPWASAQESQLIDDILDAARYFSSLTARHLRALQPYMVNIRRWAAKKYEAQGLIIPDPQLNLSLWCGDYDQLLGLTEDYDVNSLIF